ncbi:hypothetical protein [Endozoicomonas sp. Mp262]|uniref:hypothetical protein n=1 Tax=Endozoicomonas sp. Mp262 TaxID=2919499 RepID=UPI0021D9A28A
MVKKIFFIISLLFVFKNISYADGNGYDRLSQILSYNQHGDYDHLSIKYLPSGSELAGDSFTFYRHHHDNLQDNNKEVVR